MSARRKIKLDTQILDALESGYGTVKEISSLIGIPSATCSAILCILRDSGLVKVVGKRVTGTQGRPSNIYSLIEGISSMTRKVLPTRRRCEHLSMTCGNGKYTVSVGRYSDGVPAEVFVSSSRPSSEISDVARDASILISIALQYGVPLRAMRDSITRLSDNSAASIIGAVLDLIAPPDNDAAGAQIDPLLSRPRYFDCTTYTKPSANKTMVEAL